jgi:iron complex transport system substrate-binding protein
MTRPPAAPRAVGRRVAALATALLLGLTACSPFGGTTEANPLPTSTPGPTRYPGDTAAFPATITHRYGETQVDTPPERIVTLGRHDVDTVLSLGIHPIGVRDPFGADQAYNDWPWAPADVGEDEMPTVSGTTSIDFDAIAALKPDLITAVHSDLTEADYQHLTEIAHTIAQPPDVADLQSSWQEETRMIGAALGRGREAEQVITDTEETFRKARTAHPEFGDADVALVAYSSDGTLRLVNPYEPRARFLAALGMRFPDTVVSKVGAEPFDKEVDLAALRDLGDLDALVWLADPTEDAVDLSTERDLLEHDPAYRALPVVRKAASVFLDAPEAVAFGSSISLRYAADQNQRALARALRAKARADLAGIDKGLLPGEETPGTPQPTRSATAKPKPKPRPTKTPKPPTPVPTAAPSVAPAPTATPPTSSPPAAAAAGPRASPPPPARPQGTVR